MLIGSTLKQAEGAKMTINSHRWSAIKSRLSFIYVYVIIPIVKFWFSKEILLVPWEITQTIRAQPLTELYKTYVTHINLSDETLINPSVLKIKDRWLIAVRSSNYKVVGIRNLYKVEGGFKNIQSKNGLFDYDNKFKFHHTPILLDKKIPHEIKTIAPNGLEDPRLFSWNNQIWGLWNGGHVLNNAGDCLNTMIIGRIEGDTIEHTMVLPSPYGRSREKNWMPFVVNEELHFLYDLEHMEVLMLRDGLLKFVSKETKPIPALRKHSGSSQLLPWGNNNWIGVIHFAARGGQRAFPYFPTCYLHRFIIISNEFKVQSISRFFSLSSKGIEFCAGLAIDGDRVILSFGGNQDSTANILEISREQVINLF